MEKSYFFTGGWCDVHLHLHGEHAKERSLAQGAPLDAIAFDDSKITSTYMEAEELKERMANCLIIIFPFNMDS